MQYKRSPVLDKVTLVGVVYDSDNVIPIGVFYFSDHGDTDFGITYYSKNYGTDWDNYMLI